MSHTADVAVTLRHTDYSETSQVLVLFGRAVGKIHLVAKGIKRGTKKRFAAGLDLLEMGHLVFSQRQERQGSLATLVEWRQITVFPGLRTDLSRLYCGQYLAEVTTQLTEDRDPHETLFDALAGSLRALETADRPISAVVEYQVRLLTEIGLFPKIDRCVECARSWRGQTGWYFSSHRGGLVCRDCESVLVEKRRLRAGAVELLTGLRERGDPGPQDDSRWIGGFDVLDYHIAHLMGRPPAMADYVVPQAARRTLT